ncbi:MAG: DNA starvation/stationary phase protection protein [Thermoplasmata archaeon]|nr:DNA starvation/stationary phase protection protein [Thermoplasmata archaeon]
MERTKKSPIVEALRCEQANAVQLYLQYKGYHWNVSGPLFHDLHTMFDAHAKEVFETIDPIAERQRILGAPAEYTLESVQKLSNLRTDEKLPGSPKEMVERLIESHHEILRGLKVTYELANHANDAGTVDLATRCVAAHEKMEWFLREILESRAAVLEGHGLGLVSPPEKRVEVRSPT